jgi:hypothetical protein
LHVAPSGDGSDGLSWETAFRTLSEAVAASATGDSVWIKEGTYPERISVTDLKLYGGFAGTESLLEFGQRDWILNKTVISGSTSDFTIPLVELRGDSTIDGLTVSDFDDWSAISCVRGLLVISNCIVERIDPGVRGAIFLNSSDCTLSNSIIRHNKGRGISFGPGLGQPGRGVGVTCLNSRLKIDECTFTNNVVYGAPTRPGRGGSMYIGNSDVEIIKSKIENNVAGDAVSFFPTTRYPGKGCGIDAVNSNLIMRDCDVRNNGLLYDRSFVTGSGLAAQSCTLYFENVEFLGNDAGNMEDAVGISEGGGLYIVDSTSEFHSCHLADNTSVIGAAAVIRGGTAHFENCRVTGNVSKESSACVYGPTEEGTGTVVGWNYCTASRNVSLETPMSPVLIEEGAIGSVRNSIVWGNDPGKLGVTVEGQLTSLYSNIEGVPPGEGGILADPLFRDPNNGDFRLQLSSPCIDAATTTGSARDLDGDPRPVDVFGVGHDGPGAFDMGAYEFQLPQGDLNSNGLADPFDLFIFQRDWMKSTG